MKKIISKEKCRVEGCKRQATVHIHKLCNAHYCRYHRTGLVGNGVIRSRQFLKPFKSK